MKNHFLTFITLIILSTALGQNRVSHKDGSELSTALYMSNLSPDGKWIVVKEAFPHNKRNAMLINIETLEKITILDGQVNTFSADNKWFVTSVDNKLQITSLEHFDQEVIHDITDFELSYNGQYLAIMQREKDKSPYLEIRELQNNRKDRYKGVVQFAWNPNKLELMYIQDDINLEIFFLNPHKKKTRCLPPLPAASLHFAKWNATGTGALLLVEEKEKQKLYLIDQQNISILDDETLQKVLPFVEINTREPFISDDGNKVLFYTQPQDWKQPTPKNMQIWRTEDPALFPLLDMYNTYKYPFLLTAWFPHENKIIEIATKELPHVETNVNHDFALLSNRFSYGHQFIEFPTLDIWLKNISDGAEIVITAEQPTQYHGIGISPNGKFLTYFKNEHWHCYDVENRKTFNLTKNIPVSFVNRDNEYSRSETFEWPAWTPNDEQIILTEKYDLWLVNPDGTGARRLTAGRETNRSYSINNEEFSENVFFHTVPGGMVTKIENPNEILLKVTDHKTFQSGYSIVNLDGKNKDLILKEGTCSRGYKLPHTDKLIYMSESITSPKGIYSYDYRIGEENAVYQSNSNLSYLNQIKYEIIEYTIKDKRLCAALVYPLDYDPQIKYPLISYIYEKQSDMIRRFYPPSDYSTIGFNILNYVTAGYFVLLPDFHYTIGAPGISALESLEVALNKTLVNKSIDKSKLGLIGHSFGGYEAAFIATQTDRFAAIVAGAPVTNFVSHYHGVNWNHLNTDAWRYEDQQWRMGDSYYKIKEDYLKNSPLEHVEHLKTPLLIWTGKEDYQITWTQSLEMFVAMTRLNKKGKFLLFPNESHTLHQSRNQKALSQQIKSWFQEFLK